MDIFDAISKWLQSDEEDPFTSKERKPKVDSKRIVIGYRFGSDMEKPELTITGDVDKEEVDIDTSKLNDPMGLLFEYLKTIQSIKDTQKKRIKGIFLDIREKIIEKGE